MATSIQLTCGTRVPVEAIDELAFHLMIFESISATSISRHIRKLDVEGKLLDELKEVVGWTPPS